ncbi:CDP-glycerol glycerophosphotransferase family protein [Francisella philomiragia]|uniref:Putative cDP-glycerol:poly(Glycerophosphate) glycerophosphotransferase n=1 Tax=Francisella philomiragia TaxID=28110 RepID=A0A0B6D4Z3_9GAMM|nr:CDP-glycerol glycerophosphotransferase family protein [Francisella philomiragia]AJI53362.1 putative cDP-glycerol:poly(Glycerophosphate) glycerophosphotransferase [Francisella philomiragia]
MTSIIKKAIDKLLFSLITKTKANTSCIEAIEHKLSGQQNKLSELENKLSEQQNKLSEQQNKLSEQQNKLSEQQNKLSEQQNKLSEQQKIIDVLDKKSLIGYALTKQQELLESIKDKQKIKVVFFVIHESVWGYDHLYRLMDSSDKFEPIIVICPYLVHGELEMHRTMNDAYSFFKHTKKYQTIKSYDESNYQFIDVSVKINPDIIFFTNPHNLTRPEYYIDYWFDKALTCYVNYSFILTKSEESQFNQLFHNLTWRNFYETSIHEKMAYEYALNKAKNVVVSGYPKADFFIDDKYIPTNPWISQDSDKKKVIWAPHHSIHNSDLSFSCFLRDADFMLDMAKKYENEIQIAFKPHPLLRAKLELDWGADRTKAYYNEWSNLSNAQVETGDYIDLFLTSDAMIFDSNSFITEYLYTLKPALFTIIDLSVYNKFNEYGDKVFEVLDKAETQAEIENFIKKIINNTVDKKLKQKKHFIEAYLKPRGNSASKFIFDYLLEEINN